MKEETLLTWLRNQQENIDEIIADAGKKFIQDNHSNPNFSFDLAECQSESFNLIQHKDLCYDRPNTPLVYSLWYQARRINTFIHFFAKSILRSGDKLIEIFDLGAGTGAVQLAAGLISCGLKELSNGGDYPSIRIINIDTSPFMLSYNKEYLWPSFLKKYPGLKENLKFQIEYSVNSWNVGIERRATNPWLTASYLFDITDKLEETASDFIKIVRQYQPTTVLLLTSNQYKKVKMLERVGDVLKGEGYRIEAIDETQLLFGGDLQKTNRLRSELGHHYNGRGLNSSASWRDGSFQGLTLRKNEMVLNLVEDPQRKISKIQLFNPPIKVRSEITLSEEQQKAVDFFDRPSIIIGPAGSGKSVVISEKVATLVKKRDYDPNLKILVTSFNKGLIRKLGDWVENLLDSDKIQRIFLPNSDGTPSTITFQHSNSPNILIYHFDILPTRIGNIHQETRNGNTPILKNDSYHIGKLEEFAAAVIKEERVSEERHLKVLDPEFLLEEYHRVVYGFKIKNKADYLSVSRAGRWNSLGRVQRDLVFAVISQYAKFLDENNYDSFITRRRKFLNKLLNGGGVEKFEYVFVDEFQDCTPADFDIFFNLFRKPIHTNNFFIAGDLAQAINIGKSADIPRDENMNKRESFYLTGSYRLPQKVSEAINPLSKAIVSRFRSNAAAKEISPVKNSPPGARPIIVYSPTLLGITNKIAKVYSKYKIYDIDKISILERDVPLLQSIRGLNITAETSTILKLKGLEKRCILWSTRSHIDDPQEAYEFVYTILTRTSSILIIALSDETRPEYKKIINLLNIERLLFWDEETKSKFNDFCEDVELELPNVG